MKRMRLLSSRILLSAGGWGGCKRSLGRKGGELIQIGATQRIGLGAVGPDATTGVLGTLAEQDEHRDPRKAAAALRTQARRGHTARLFQRSKKSGFLCEMPPTKHICGWVQSKVAAWGACAGVGSLPASLMNKEGLPIIKSHVLLL